jgi:multidrug efflux pump subunit AcrB
MRPPQQRLNGNAMSKFFIDRPIVAMVISILTVIVGVVVIAGLPVALFPQIAPPEIQIWATYVGAGRANYRAIGGHAH